MDWVSSTFRNISRTTFTDKPERSLTGDSISQTGCMCTINLANGVHVHYGNFPASRIAKSHYPHASSQLISTSTATPGRERHASNITCYCSMQAEHCG
eukprot:2918191-Amphidinium_carterae.2